MTLIVKVLLLPESHADLMMGPVPNTHPDEITKPLS